jgi:hypothetical protein
MIKMKVKRIINNKGIKKISMKIFSMIAKFNIIENKLIRVLRIQILLKKLIIKNKLMLSI